MENERLKAGRDGRNDLSPETKFSGAAGKKGKIVFPIQLTTTKLILLYCCSTATIPVWRNKKYRNIVSENRRRDRKILTV